MTEARVTGMPEGQGCREDGDSRVVLMDQSTYTRTTQILH